MEKKGLFVEIIGTDCTNNGVTSGKTHAVLIWPDGPKLVAPTEDLPVLELRYGRGGRRFIAIPYGWADDYPMFGGHFIYSSDGRFPSDQPIHVHDRKENGKGL